MARIPFVTAHDISAQERPAFDHFVQVRGGIPDAGPYALILHMPEVAQRVESLRLCLRDEASLTQKLQELVMITVAREMDCAYIWHAHAAASRAIGVRGDIIDGIRDKRTLNGLRADEQCAVDFTQELLRNRKVSRTTFDRATACLGQRGTLALTNLVACTRCWPTTCTPMNWKRRSARMNWRCRCGRRAKAFVQPVRLQGFDGRGVPSRDKLA